MWNHINRVAVNCEQLQEGDIVLSMHRPEPYVQLRMKDGQYLPSLENSIKKGGRAQYKNHSAQKCRTLELKRRTIYKNESLEGGNSE